MDKLCFCSAAFGNWGIVRLGTLVPESHMIFACPYSCGRHNSIGAIKHGYKDRISYLFIDERDLAMGTIDEDLANVVDAVLRTVRPQPKVILLYFSCVLYMSGFDWDALICQLEQTYPGIRFRPCMMNPVAADRKKPPVPVMIDTLCSLWDDCAGRVNAANLLGCYGKLDVGCELPTVLRECGVEDLLHFSDAKTLEEYNRLGHSRYNLVIRPEGLLAAKTRKKSIPYAFLPVTYDISQIFYQYRSIFDTLGNEADLSAYELSAREAIAKTLEKVGRRPIAVGSSAVCRPFSLARALISYGFTVTDVFFEGCPEFEVEAKNDLEIIGTIEFHDIHDPQYSEQVGSIGRAELAIGYSAGYYTGANHVVDLMIDDGMFGYGGVCRLMELMQQAIESPVAVQTMIESYGLII